MLPLVLAAVSLAAAAPPQVLPVVVRTDRDAYTGNDSITVTLENRDKQPVWVEPLIRVERSEGDGRWTSVYSLRVVGTCPAEPPPKLSCVKIGAGARLELASWDWNTGGYTQCPPRRPGHRAFKGVHRLVLEPCGARSTVGTEPRIKLVTFE